MQAPVLTVSVLTPQSWAERQSLKRRRVPRSPRRKVQTPALADARVPKTKQHLRLTALDGQPRIKKSPTNGLLLDPFQTFPIPTTPFVASMAQYFVQVWGAQHGRAFAFEGHPNPYLSLLWPFALQNDIYFEGLIALCRATHLATTGQPVRTDHAFASHRGNVMTKLRARLQSPQQCSDDTTMLTVATLGTIDYILGDHTAATAHVSGMRQMIRIRGGFETSSPWEKLLKANVDAYEALWSFLFTAETMSNTTSHYSGHLVQTAEFPVYMAHPFKPEVCEMLAKLPQGFCDIGLTGVLSLQMIRLLSDFCAMKATLSSSALPLDTNVASMSSRTIQTTLEDLHRLATLQTTPTERFLAHGLVAYCYLLRAVYFQDPLSVFYETVLKALTDIALHQVPSHRAPDRKCYLWTNMMIATTVQNGHVPPAGWKSVMQLFFDKYQEARQWHKLEKELKNFFWDDEIRKLSKDAYDEAVKRRQKENSEDPDAHLTTMAIRNVVL